MNAIKNSVNVINPSPKGTCFPRIVKLKGHLEFALARIGVAQNQHRQAVHGKTPDDADA